MACIWPTVLRMELSPSCSCLGLPPMSAMALATTAMHSFPAGCFQCGCTFWVLLSFPLPPAAPPPAPVALLHAAVGWGSGSEQREAAIGWLLPQRAGLQLLTTFHPLCPLGKLSCHLQVAECVDDGPARKLCMLARARAVAWAGVSGSTVQAALGRSRRGLATCRAVQGQT